MEIKQGKTRIVLIGEERVAKIPHPKNLSIIRKAIQGREKDFLLKKEARTRVLEIISMVAGIGIQANKREAKLFEDFPDLVVPIRFQINSLGLLNIQDKAEPFGISWEDRHKIFTDNIGRMVMSINHTIEGTGNFGVHEGKIKIVDGGDYGLEKILHTNRKAFERALSIMEEMINLR
jgi:hypothetical protein